MITSPEVSTSQPWPVLTRRQHWSAFGGLVSLGARSVLAFRADLFVGVIGAMMRVVLVFAVWTAVYGNRTQVAGIDHQTAIGYAVLGALLNLVLQPWQFSSLISQVRDGSVVFHLMRPVGLITIEFGQQLGSTIAQLPKGLAGLAVGLAIGALVAPADAVAVLAFAVSFVLGVVIALLCNLLVAMTSFWTLEAGGAMIIYRMAAGFCSGALIPLWFMPAGLASVLRFLPFSAQVFTPLSIFFDPRPGWHTVGELAIQLLWVVLLAGLLQLVWSRAHHRVVINGG